MSPLYLVLNGYKMVGINSASAYSQVDKTRNKCVIIFLGICIPHQTIYFMTGGTVSYSWLSIIAQSLPTQ